MSNLLQLGALLGAGSLATTLATTAEELAGPATVPPPAGPPGTDFFSVDVFTGGSADFRGMDECQSCKMDAF